MNARQAQLEEQRARSRRLYFMGLGQRRLSPSLMPANSAVSSIAKRYDKEEDRVILKQWQAGEITDEAYLAHQEKILSRPYINPEEKAAGLADLKILRNQIEDKKTYEAYKVGRINKRQLLNYETNKLLSLTPGSQAHDLQVSTINEISKQVKVEERKQLRLSEEAKIEGLPGRNTPDKYTKRSDLYKRLADQARVDGQTEEADGYLQKFYEYRDYGLQIQQETEAKKATLKENQAKALKETNRNNLVDLINGQVNDYRNNRISAKDFMTNLNELEKKAVDLKETDLLNTLTDWRNYVREDISKGKPWSRGGTGAGGGGGSTEKKVLNQGKLEDLEYEKAKQALVENISDKNGLIQATAELTNRYLNGAEPTADDPDGWVGLKNRAIVVQNQLQKGKGSVTELTSLQKKIDNKEQDYNILSEAVQNPSQFGVLYKKDGTVEIFDTKEQRHVTDPENKTVISYFKQKNVADLGDGKFLEGSGLEVGDPSTGKNISGTYWGKLPDGQTYQWLPGKKPVTQEDFLKRAEELKSQNLGNKDLIRGVNDVVNSPLLKMIFNPQFSPIDATGLLKGAGEKIKRFFTPKTESYLPGSNQKTLLAEAGINDLTPTKSTSPFIGTRILPTAPVFKETASDRQDRVTNARTNAVQTGQILRDQATQRVTQRTEPAPVTETKPVVIPPSTPLWKPLTEPTGLRLAGETPVSPIQANAQNISNGRTYYINSAGNLEQGGKEIQVPSKQITQPPQPPKPTSQLNIGNQTQPKTLSVPSGWKPTQNPTLTPKPQESILAKIKNLATSIWPFNRR